MSRRGGVGEIRILRHLEMDGPLHRMWAGTKLVSVAAVSLMLSLRPTWGALAVGASLLGGAFLLGRLPLGVLPRPPRIVFAIVAFYAFQSALAGGKPEVHVFGFAIGLAAAGEFGRWLLLTVLLLFACALLGWTTLLADLPGALRVLLAPLAWFKVPVDEVVGALALSVRCLPLVIDELRSLLAARRARHRPPEHGVRARVHDAMDLLTTAMVSSVRRAAEMAEAIEARGGLPHPPRERPRLNAYDALAGVVMLGACVAMAVL